MAYARLIEKAEKIIIIKTTSVKNIAKLEDGTEKSFWSSKATTIVNQPVTQPISGIKGLPSGEAKEIQIWLNNQLDLIDRAYEQNYLNGLVGGHPVIKHSKSDDTKYELEPCFIPGCKVGEFIGIIAGAKPRRNIGTEKKSQPTEGFVRKMREEGRLAEITESLVNEIVAEMAASNCRPQEVFSEEERAALYEAERQLFYLITQAIEKQSPLEKRAKEAAVERFDRLKSSGPEGYLIGKTKPVPVLLQEFAAKN